LRVSRIILGNILVFLFLVSFIFPCGEIYYRFIYDTTDSFGLTKVTKNWLRQHYHFNRSGVRDTVNINSPERPYVRRRISFIGDSFTVGYGIKNPEDRFVNRIRDRRQDWEVHLFASNALDTGAEIQGIQKILQSGYQLDQVVLVYNLNDISDIVPEWHAILDRIYRSSEPGFLVKHSYFLNTFYYHYVASRDPDIKDYYRFVLLAYEGPIWEEQKKRLKFIKELIHQNGGSLKVVTFPFLHALGLNYPYRPVHEKLDDFWRSLGVPHLDLLPVYEVCPPGSLIINAHDAHPNRYAHQLASYAIIEFLDKYLPLRKYQNIRTKMQVLTK